VESSWLHTQGEFHYGGVVKVNFAHHGKGKIDPRKLNVDPFVARLINGKMATLHELKTIYSLQDAYYLNEVLDLNEEQIYLNNKRK